MQAEDVTKMSTNDIAKALVAFYEFVNLFGYGYLNEEGKQRFNDLKGEYARRRAASQQIAEEMVHRIPDYEDAKRLGYLNED